MPTQKCIDNVNSSPPPANVWCGDDVCAAVQQTVDSHCNLNGYQPNDAYILFTGNPPKQCACCCSCYGHETPIEVQPGVFFKVQDIRTGDAVLAAGPSLVWQPVTVSFASGMQTQQPAYPVLNVVYRYDEGDIRLLQVTDDTLFLMDSGLLKTAEVLVPGDRLRRADGGEAEIIGPVTKALSVGVHSIELGPFDGYDLEGHLLNSYGVVTADLSVQRPVSRGGLRDEKVVDGTVFEPDVPVAGSEEYLSRYTVTREFLEEIKEAGIHLDPTALEPPRAMITIPANAKAFLGEAQARNLLEAAPKFSSTNTFRITVADKILYMARPVQHDVVMLIDWNNNLPTAFAWTQLRQRFVVLTGGLLRLKDLTEAGIALVLAHALAYHTGAECVGEADHAAINNLRQIWPHSLFPAMCEQGVGEIRTLFRYVDEPAAEGNPDDRCQQPSLDCRLEAYVAAMTMMPVPECAAPDKRED
ncbi:hypothetical protein ACIP9X_19390 [Arthrobacter sp. NPDC093125]|uniref:hypothetical protein n=1 Tax=Arthrobacter sp. NPDC093125 TaxID=3363944 RepID=UPI0038284E7A